MKITDILKAKGMFSKDIRIRLKNGQLRLNGEVIKDDVEVTTLELSEVEGKEVTIDDIIEDAGDFLFFNICKDPVWTARCHMFGFEELFNSPISDDLTDFLDIFNLLRISKRELIVIKKS